MAERAGFEPKTVVHSTKLIDSTRRSPDGRCLVGFLSKDEHQVL